MHFFAKKMVQKREKHNMLALNIGKANFLLFFSPRKKLSGNFSLTIGNQEFQRTKYVKFLGVLMDEHLSWKYNAVELCHRIVNRQ